MLNLNQIAVMGFRPLNESEWNGFAGAEPGTLIAYSGNTIYLLHGNVLSAIEEPDFEDEDAQYSQIDYTYSADAEQIC
jgi:hypothetical protein